jgi:hypothetical protein
VVSTDDDPGHDTPSPFAAIGGVDLEAYVAVCRALVRTSGGPMRRRVEVLAQHGLTPASWELVSGAWSSRIRGHAAVHAEFGRLYVGASDTSREIE